MDPVTLRTINDNNPWVPLSLSRESGCSTGQSVRAVMKWRSRRSSGPELAKGKAADQMFLCFNEVDDTQEGS